jgi:RecQ family ATP-dependent DNA helicase
VVGVSPSAMNTTADPEALLARFGLERFRPGQREAVEAALQGRDSLVVMPTGGGKSVCYQLPALADVGLVVVVSPLIALMADQLRRLQEAGVEAAMIASGMGEGHNERALAALRTGGLRLVLVAPERFASRAFVEALGRVRVGLFVVDEAHCVTEWGHDFRPDYLRLHDAIEAVGRPPVMAATATATPRVAKEIAARLGLREWTSVRSGFDRPNLSFDVVATDGKGALARKREVLARVLSGDGALPAIVYCGTRKDTDTVATALERAGLRTVAYHAGMSGDARTASQQAFMDGHADVIVATNAFGMGVDKADVRTVAHWALPTSLEAYYQEAGRAGRDGEPARALLLAARMDLGRLIRFIGERDTSVDAVRRFVAGLRGRSQAGTLSIGHGELGDRERVLLSLAERAGAAELAPGGREGLLVTLTGRGSPRKAHAAIREARSRGWESYRSIERYMSERVCRRRQILEHFGDPSEPAPLGRCCDVCDPDPALDEALAASHAALRRRQTRPAPAPAGGAEAVGEREFEALREWRMAQADGLPAYTVATNSVLEELLRTRPRNVDELIAIDGIGPAFCRKHGESVLRVLAGLP